MHGAFPALLLALALGGCTTVNSWYDPGKAHHRPDGFVNNDPSVRGGAPWYEVIQRRWRGDFRPLAEPEGGYAAFAERWLASPDRAQLDDPAGPPRITWLGHASLLLQAGGRNILIDPNLSDHAGPFSWLSARRQVPPPLTVKELPRIDLVLISHNHYDHLCYGTLRRLRDAGQSPRFVVPLGLADWFTQRGMGPVTALNWWEHTDIAPGVRVVFTPSQHWSRRTPWDTNASLWGGYLLEWARPQAAAPWRFLFPGDTGYSEDFKAIRQRLGPVDFLALPIGAYLPRDFMKPMHVNPEDAVQLMLDVEARQAMGVHWGTFMLTQEAFDHPPRDLAAALAQRGLPLDRVWLLRQGETRAIPLP